MAFIMFSIPRATVYMNMAYECNHVGAIYKAINFQIKMKRTLLVLFCCILFGLFLATSDAAYLCGPVTNPGNALGKVNGYFIYAIDPKVFSTGTPTFTTCAATCSYYSNALPPGSTCVAGVAMNWTQVSMAACLTDLTTITYNVYAYGYPQGSPSWAPYSASATYSDGIAPFITNAALVTQPVGGTPECGFTYAAAGNAAQLCACASFTYTTYSSSSSLAQMLIKIGSITVQSFTVMDSNLNIYSTTSYPSTGNPVSPAPGYTNQLVWKSVAPSYTQTYIALQTAAGCYPLIDDMNGHVYCLNRDSGNVVQLA